MDNPTRPSPLEDSCDSDAPSPPLVPPPPFVAAGTAVSAPAFAAEEDGFRHERRLHGRRRPELDPHRLRHRLPRPLRKSDQPDVGHRRRRGLPSLPALRRLLGPLSPQRPPTPLTLLAPLTTLMPPRRRRPLPPLPHRPPPPRPAPRAPARSRRTARGPPPSTWRAQSPPPG